ncbi:Sparc protein [Dirofilaria immitis]|nr:Sparc protein [Dirofilaria immitis]
MRKAVKETRLGVARISRPYSLDYCRSGSDCGGVLRHCSVYFSVRGDVVRLKTLTGCFIHATSTLEKQPGSYLRRDTVNFGSMRVDACSRSGENHEVEFSSAAVHTVATGKLAGNFDVKYRIPSYGVVLTEKWNTENLLGTIIEIQDRFARGLKLTLDSWYAPHNGKRSGRVKAEWANRNITCNLDVGLDTGPQINFSGVTGLHGWLLGAQSAFDVSSSQLKAISFSFGRIGTDYVLHSYVNDAREFGGSFYHSVAHNLDIGAMFSWTTGEPGARFGLAMKYCPTKDLELKAKVDHDSKLAFALTHNLSNRLKLTLSSQFGMASFSDGHKYGIDAMNVAALHLGILILVVSTVTSKKKKENDWDELETLLENIDEQVPKSTQDSKPAPIVPKNPCDDHICGWGKECIVDNGGEPICKCISKCPSSDDDPLDQVCSNTNETFPSLCELYRERCLCKHKLQECKNKANSKVHLEYLGACKELEPCTNELMVQFPVRMADWLFQVMREMKKRRELHNLEWEELIAEAESDDEKKHVYPVIWKFCDLDIKPHDKHVSHHELIPITAPVIPMESCIKPFLENCDINNDGNISIKEWGKCLGLKEGEIQERC